jgi:hypothetical protein
MPGSLRTSADHYSLGCLGSRFRLLESPLMNLRMAGMGYSDVAEPCPIRERYKETMSWYPAHDACYKRGEFYGLSEEIHIHMSDQ